MSKPTTIKQIDKQTEKGIYVNSKKITFDETIDWKKCTEEEFKLHIAKLLVFIKENNPKSVLISKNYLLINILGIHTKHWRRDMLHKKVVKGERKLELLLKIIYLQEQNLLDYMMSGLAPSIAGMIYSVQFKKEYELEDLDLSENETLKEGIKIEIKGSGLKYD